MISVISITPPTAMSETNVPVAVRDLALIRAVFRGAQVFQAGTPAHHVFFLLRGRVALHRFGPFLVPEAVARGELRPLGKKDDV
jgi:hypothetical protein